MNYTPVLSIKITYCVNFGTPFTYKMKYICLHSWVDSIIKNFYRYIYLQIRDTDNVEQQTKDVTFLRFILHSTIITPLRSFNCSTFETPWNSLENKYYKKLISHKNSAYCSVTLLFIRLCIWVLHFCATLPHWYDASQGNIYSK